MEKVSILTGETSEDWQVTDSFKRKFMVHNIQNPNKSIPAKPKNKEERKKARKEVYEKLQPKTRGLSVKSLSKVSKDKKSYITVVDNTNLGGPSGKRTPPSRGMTG